MPAFTNPKIEIVPIRKAPCSTSSSESPPEQSTDDAAKVKEKKTRASKPKVRSGCVTCKVRRVKCDETKPQCNRCTSTGRKCDGYAIKPRKKRSDALVLNKTVEVNTDIGPAELRFLGYFHHKTAPMLSSYFDASFWTQLVFQMSYVEPAVRHAMVSVGALHEQREHGLTLLPLQPQLNNPSTSLVLTKKDWGTQASQNNEFALSQYGKAILLLSKRLTSDSAVEVALLACILFVCVEFLRGDSVPAVNHFRSGMGIALNALSQKGTAGSDATVERIKEYMLPFLNRLELLSNMFGSDASWPYTVDLSDTVPTEFHSMREARDSIVHIANLSIRFIKSMSQKKYTGAIQAADLEQQAALQHQLDLWETTLDNMLLGEDITRRDLDAAKTLRIHKIVAVMWLQRATEPSESANDGSHVDAETAVSLAEAIQSFAGTKGQRVEMGSSSFLFDMEIVSPLYFIATKCRHPQIRRRAIAVLKKSYRREGLWDSETAATIAERQMEIEEANLTTLDGSELPAEVDRVHNIQIHTEPGIVAKKNELIIHMKPFGVDGPWKVWHEELVLR